MNWLEKGLEAYKLGDYEIALNCYEKAIEEGNSDAMYLAACMYTSGVGVEKNIQKSRELFRQSADAGNEKAKNTLDLIAKPPIVHSGVHPSIRGRDGISKAREMRKKGKYEEAMEGFLSLIDDYTLPDHYTSECMYWVGIMYKLGQGVIKDEKKATDWIRKSMDLGYWPAIKELQMDKKPEVVCEESRAKATTFICNKFGFANEAVLFQFCKIASKFKSKIELRSKSRVVDAKSILMVIAIGGLQGTKLDICAEGEDAAQAVQSLVDYLFSVREN